MALICILRTDLNFDNHCSSWQELVIYAKNFAQETYVRLFGEVSA